MNEAEQIKKENMVLWIRFVGKPIALVIDVLIWEQGKLNKWANSLLQYSKRRLNKYEQ